MKSIMVGLVAAAALALFPGCQKQSAEVETSSATQPSAELEKVVVADGAPAAQSVLAAKKNVKDGDQVAVEGRLRDFMEGSAGFVLTDGSLKSCKEEEGDSCKTPWDYCCLPKEQLNAASATIQLVGEAEQPLTGNLKGVRSLDHLTSVVVEGKARRDDGGNLMVQAKKVYLVK